MIRVLLADEQGLVRAGFRSLLDSQDDIDVVAEAEDGEDAIRLGARAQTSTSFSWTSACLGWTGLEATRAIAAEDDLEETHVSRAMVKLGAPDRGPARCVRS